MLLSALFLATLSASALSQSLPPNAASCDADNCLRALRRRHTLATPFCSTYIAPSTTTSTQSTTKTIYSIVSPTITTAPVSFTKFESPLLPTPTYATPCTLTSRLSSACSCLLSTPASILTVTVPEATTTVPVCDPELDYGIGYATPTFEDLINVQAVYPNVTGAQQCCATCYETPGCLTYALGAGNRTQGQCALAVAVEGSINGPGIGEVCPYGVYLAFNGKGKEVGLGPCVDWREGTAG
ncbi:MAG: hypothetical protein Q9219_002033 [cf. Caloplaca sp. 3 TL-2023]